VGPRLHTTALLSYSFKRALSLIFLVLSNLSLRHVSVYRILGHATDREALLKFKSGIDEASLRVLASRNDTKDFCQWARVICSPKRQQTVVAMDLRRMNLAGFPSSCSRESLFPNTTPSEITLLLKLGIFNQSFGQRLQ